MRASSTARLTAASAGAAATGSTIRGTKDSRAIIDDTVSDGGHNRRPSTQQQQQRGSSNDGSSGRRPTFASTGCQAATQFLQRHRPLHASPYLSRYTEIVTASDDGCARSSTASGTTTTNSNIASQKRYLYEERPPLGLLRPRIAGAYLVEDVQPHVTTLDDYGTHSLVIANKSAAPARRVRYESFDALLDRYIERGFVDIRLLVHHQEAPPAAMLLETVLQHCTPCLALTTETLIAVVHASKSDYRHAGQSAAALQRVAEILRTCCPLLYQNQSVRILLMEALLFEKLFAEVAVIFKETEDSWITAGLWSRMVCAAAEGKLADSDALDRLLSVHADNHSRVGEGRWLTRAGELSCCHEYTANGDIVEEAYAQEHGRVAPPISGEDAAAPRGVFGVRSAASILSTSCTVVDPSQSEESLRQLTDGGQGTASSTDNNNNNNTNSVVRAGGEVAVVPTTNKGLVNEQELWTQMSSGEIGYAMEHYQGLSQALGDHRGGDAMLTANLQLFTSSKAFIDDLRLSASNTQAFDQLMPPGSLRERWAGSAMLSGSQGVVFGLDAKTAAQLMLRAGVSFRGQASPVLALHILRRYVRSCRVLRSEATRLKAQVDAEIAALTAWQQRNQSSSSSSREDSSLRSRETQIAKLKKRYAIALQAAAPSPSPFLIFFNILREARDVLGHGDANVGNSLVSSSPASPHASTAKPQALPMMHWELAWHYFQVLNRENPSWYEQLPPAEASEVCCHVMELLTRGAEPWMILNVARQATKQHIVDALDISLWLLHHLDPSHHTEEAKDVTRQLFRWLLGDVGLHLHKKLHHHLIPVARVLIRVGLHAELTAFYNAVLDSAYNFTEEFRSEFMHVMSDLVCPSCSSILSDHDVYKDRTCANCLTVVAGKDVTSIPSFHLSAQHIERIRERRKQQRQKEKRRMYSHVESIPSSSDRRSAASARPAMDAAAVFKKELLRDSPPLLPGVSVTSEFGLLFPLEGASTSEGGATALLDVRAALEESTRRLSLQRAAREYSLSLRGDAHAEEAMAALPTSSLMTAAAESTLTSSRRGASPLVAAAPQQCLDGAWVCVWCQENNSQWASRVQCGACGAETGPAAPWRRFAYAEDGDVMGELRARISNAEERPVDAIVAAYLLMVYRRAFLLRATPHDYERVQQLIAKLCMLHERVLAAYTYTRCVAPPQRRKDSVLLMLAQLFGGVDGYHALSPQDLKDDDKLFAAVFTPATCKVCFGSHDWKVCPIVTRDFVSSAQASSINLTPEEKQKAVLEHLVRVVQKALDFGAENSKFVVDAYVQFVTSSFRELFAEVHASESNALCMLLSSFKQYRRAAFVLCHIPLHLRHNESYIKLIHYFNVTEEEAMPLLSKRAELTRDQVDGHPNFVQVTMTCCMCLDQRHASFACPRLQKWLEEVSQLLTSPLNTTGAASGHMMVNMTKEQRVTKRLMAQADGWITAGPERLHAFYRFLLEHVDVLRPQTAMTPSSAGTMPLRRRMDLSDPFVYALNKTISKLAAAGKSNQVYRLYARSPMECISQATTIAVLRMNKFSEDAIRALLNASPSDDAMLSSSGRDVPSSSEAARTAAVPMNNVCLLCFEKTHAFYDCTELTAQAGLAEKLKYVCQHVGGIACCPSGVNAASAYIYHSYNKGLLSSEILRANPSLVQDMLLLTCRCFATKQLATGVRLLRRLPLEMVPPDSVYPLLWRAAGLPEDVVEARRIELLALYDAEGLVPSSTQPPPRRTYSARFMTNLGRALHDDLCRHCYEHGHSISTCSVFHADVSFGRDYVAAYRMSMMSEQLDRDWQDAYLMKLVDFFRTHQMFMPYHIAGVSNALNAIAAMWSFRGEPGIALQHLLAIPPAYRRRPAFKHILHALQVPTAEVSRLLAGFYFSPDDTHTATGSVRNETVVAQHLLMPKPAIRDVAMKSVFGQYPAAMEALAQAEERMAVIRGRSGASQKAAAGSVTAAMKQRLGAGADANPSMHAMQSGDTAALRDDFDPILTELEDAVGMKLGSRHILFTSAVDIISGAPPSPAASAQPKSAPPPEAEVVSEVVRGAKHTASSNKHQVGHSDEQRNSNNNTTNRNSNRSHSRSNSSSRAPSSQRHSNNKRYSNNNNSHRRGQRGGQQ